MVSEKPSLFPYCLLSRHMSDLSFSMMTCSILSEDNCRDKTGEWDGWWCFRPDRLHLDRHYRYCSLSNADPSNHLQLIAHCRLRLHPVFTACHSSPVPTAGSRTRERQTAGVTAYVASHPSRGKMSSCIPCSSQIIAVRTKDSR